MNDCDRITTRIFLGVLISKEIQAALFMSAKWRNAKAMPSSEDLIDVRHGGDFYIGCYLPENRMLLTDIKNTEAFIGKKLALYAPSLESVEISCVVFPQLFVQ